MVLGAATRTTTLGWQDVVLLPYGVVCHIAHWNGYGRTHIPHAPLGKLTMPTNAVQTCEVKFPVNIPNAKPSVGCKAVPTLNSVKADEVTVNLAAKAVVGQRTSCNLDCNSGYYYSKSVDKALICSAEDKTPNPNVEPTGTTNLNSVSSSFKCQGLWQPR